MNGTLSRAVPTAIQSLQQAVLSAIRDCIALIGGPRLATDPAPRVAFRPQRG